MKSAIKKLTAVVFFILAFTIIPQQAQAAPLDASNFNYFIHGQTTIEGSIFHTGFCAVMGVSPFNMCAGYQASSGGTQPVVMERLPNGGAYGSLASVMGTMYDRPPTSSTYYLARLGEDIGVVPQTAYAQSMTGSGNAVLQPIYQLWQLSRNIAYLAFVIVFVVIGFMIMLRQRINPQTVVTAQQALPGLVVGLVLVTFSYFIAALIVDMAFLGVNVVAQLFATVPSSFGDANYIRNIPANENVFTLFSSSGLNLNNLTQVFTGTFNQTHATLNIGWSVILPAVLGGMAGALMGPFGVIGGAATGFGLGAASSLIIPGLLIMVLMLALFIQGIRLLFALLGAYISILVMTIVGPFFILAGTIPGRSGLLSNWWRTLLANVLIFPAVLVVILFAGVVLGNSARYTSAMPLFGSTDTNFLSSLIAFGALLGAPAIPGMVRQAFHAEGPAGVTGAAMGGLMGGVALGNAIGPGGYRHLWRGGAPAGAVAQGPLAKFAKAREWYRPGTP